MEFSLINLWIGCRKNWEFWLNNIGSMLRILLKISETNTDYLQFGYWIKLLIALRGQKKLQILSKDCAKTTNFHKLSGEKSD